MPDVLELAEIMELRKRVTTLEHRADALDALLARASEAMKKTLALQEEIVRGAVETSRDMLTAVDALARRLGGIG